jgi:cation diffusion facilitator CzcD-associated flavoprotein CzcO
MTDNAARSRVPERADVAIIGTGYSGVCVAILMKLAGLHDFVMLEQADTVGGTWRDNHYHGAACDIESNLYSFSFEPNPHWTRVYPQQPELQAYLLHCVEKYGLRPHLHCGAAVTEARFDDASQRWNVAVNGALRLAARVLVSGTGGLSRPSIPALAGLEDFAGPAFHSARWRHDVALQRKRIAVIGTGASAIQFVPEIAPEAAHLTLFQRTPAWIIPKPDRALSETERRRLGRHPHWQRALRAADYTVRESRALFFTRWPGVLKRLQLRIARRMQHRIADAALRAKLTPGYVLGCKRILLSNDFHAAVQRPNVSLVTAGIDRVGAGGLYTADGAFHPADVLIFATGFQTGGAGTPFPVFGLDGIELNTAWARGPQAYLGTTVTAYPNLFLMTGPNTGLGHNSMIYMIESQARYVIDALLTMHRQRLHAVDVLAAAQRDYNADLQARMRRTVWATGGCRSWYLAPDGSNPTLWPDFTFRFRHKTRRFDVERYRTWAAR